MMNDKVTNIVTTVIAFMLFGFALAGIWFGKLEASMLIPVTAVSCILIVFKNAALQGVLLKLIGAKASDKQDS